MFAIRRVGGPKLVGFIAGELLQVGAIAMHAVEIDVPVPAGAKDDPLTVGGEAGKGIVRPILSQTLGGTLARRIHQEEVLPPVSQIFLHAIGLEDDVFAVRREGR